MLLRQCIHTSVSSLSVRVHEQILPAELTRLVGQLTGRTVHDPDAYLELHGRIIP
jgi:hypothetical protein